MTEPTRILIVDDHKILRTGLRKTLEKYSAFEIVGEAEDCLTAVEYTRQYNPDLIIMDIGLPIMDGLEATEKIKEINPDIKVIILTSSSSTQEIIKEIEVGANSYINKNII